MDRNLEQCELVSWHSDMKSLVNSWIDLTRASVVRSVLELFKRAIENEIGGGISMSEEESVIETIGQNPDSIKAAFVIAGSLSKYKNISVKKYMVILEKVARERGFTFMKNDDLNMIYRGFSFTRPSWKFLKIIFEFQSRNMNELIYGIGSNPEGKDHKNYSEIQDFIKVQTVKMQHNSNWLCYQYSDNDYRNWNNSNIYLDMYRNEEADLVKYIFQKIEELESITQKADDMF